MAPGASFDLRDAIERALRAQSGRTSRQLSTWLQAQGHSVDKSEVNSVLYRNSVLFRNNGAVPPRWSLTQTAMPMLKRAPHRVYGVALNNWKAFEQVSVPVKNITLLYGENSSGKSSILQGLLLMKQSWATGDLKFEGPWGSFGWYQNVVHRQNIDSRLSLMALWGEPDDSAGLWSVLMQAADAENLAHGPAQPIARIDLRAGDEHVLLIATGWHGDLPTSSLGGDWLGLRVGDDYSASVSPGQLTVQEQTVVISSDENGYPNLEDAVVGEGSLSEASSHTLETIRQVLAGATAMFDALIHIGPYRAVPHRDIVLGAATEDTEYLARLHTDDALLTDVNEWLAKFEIPYQAEISRYGDDSFQLDLLHSGEGAERVQLRDVGFGISQLLPIITQLLGNREKTILIEEPEAHVHPRLQSVLGDLFMTSTQDYGNVLIVETHSEPILLRVQRRVAEQRISHEDVGVLHVVRHGAASMIEEVPLRENGQLDYSWPGGFFDDRIDDLVAILDPQPGD